MEETKTRWYRVGPKRGSWQAFYCEYRGRRLRVVRADFNEEAVFVWGHEVVGFCSMHRELHTLQKLALGAVDAHQLDPKDRGHYESA